MLRPRARSIDVDLDYAHSDTTVRFLFILLVAASTCYYSGTHYWHLILAPGIEQAPPSGNAGLPCLALFAVLTSVFYLVHPAVLRLRQKLRSPSGAAQVALSEDIVALARRVGVRRPEVVFSNAWRRHDAQIFGCPWKPFLRLDAGLTLLATKRRDWFNAIVTHEISHALHADVAKAYVTRAALYATILICVPISAVRLGFMLRQLNGMMIWDKVSWAESAAVAEVVLWNIVPAVQNLLLFFPLLLILLVEYALLIRAREHFADWKAATYGSRGSLMQIFSTRKSTSGGLRSAMSLHPTANQRIRFLKHPLRQSLGVRLYDAAMTGLVGALSFSLMNNIMFDLLDFFPPAEGLENAEYFVNAMSALLQGQINILPFTPMFTSLLLVGMCITYSAMGATIGNWLQGRSILADWRYGIPCGFLGTLGFTAGSFLGPTEIASPEELQSTFSDMTMVIVISLGFLVTTLLAPIAMRIALRFWQDARPYRFGLFLLAVQQTVWLFNLAYCLAIPFLTETHMSGEMMHGLVIGALGGYVVSSGIVILVFAALRGSFRFRNTVPKWLVTRHCFAGLDRSG